MLDKGALMRVLAFCLTFGVASTALAARPADSVRPADVFVVADTASPAAEVDAWAKVVAAFSPGTAVPPAQTSLPTLLGRLLGAASLDGVALDQPLYAVVLNPQKFPQPVVLSVRVRDLPALKASLAGTGLVAQASRGQAMVGA
jgi:hypothetical protein